MQIKHLILLFFSVSFLIISCQTNSNKNSSISFDKYRVADSFEIQLAASEPLLEDPVAMDFDNKGRMWVVEMRGFMPNIAAQGRISQFAESVFWTVWIKREDPSILKYFWIVWYFPEP